MGILCSLLLIAMGVLAAENFLSQKVPALKNVLSGMKEYSGYIGLAGLFFGFIWFLDALTMLKYFGSHMFLVLLVVVGSLVTLALGLILGLEFVHKLVGEPTPPFLVKVDKWRANLLPYQQNLGLTAIALGIIYLL